MRKMYESTAKNKHCPLMKKVCIGSLCMGWEFVMEQIPINQVDRCSSGVTHYESVMQDDKRSTEIGVCTAMPSPL